MVRLDIRQSPPCPVEDEALFFRVVRAAFAQRRKTLVNGLKNSPELQFSKEQIEQALNTCGLSLNIRGEALTLEQFAQLANAFEELA